MNGTLLTHIAVLAPAGSAAVLLLLMLLRFCIEYTLKVLPGRLARFLPTSGRISRAVCWGATFVCLLSLLALPSIPDPWSLRASSPLLALSPHTWLLAVSIGVVLLCSAVAAWAFDASTPTWVALGTLASAALTALTATHPALILLSLDIAYVVLGLSLALGGSPDSTAAVGSLRRAARRFLTFTVLSSAACWVGIVYLPSDPRAHWLLAAGLLSRALSFPFHTPSLSAHARLPTPLAMIFLGAVAPAAAIAATTTLGYSPHLALFLLLASAWSYAASLRESDLRRVAGRWAAAALSAALAIGLATLSPLPPDHPALGLLPPTTAFASPTPLTLLMIAAIVGAAAITYLAATVERAVGHHQIPRMGGLAARLPGVFGWTITTAFLLAGAPPFASFAGRLLTLTTPHLTPAATATALPLLLTALWVLALACSLQVIHRIFLGIPRQDAPPTELTARERLVLILLCTTALATSLSPLTLLRPPTPIPTTSNH